MKPHILQMGSYPGQDQSELEAAYTVHRYFDAVDKTTFLAAAGRDVQAIATRGDLGADAAVIAACPKLELISIYGVGFDAVDMAACRARGIRVTNTPDVLTDDVADLAVGMMLAQARGMVRADAFVRDGSWANGPYPLQRKVAGGKAGILGLGRIGGAIAHRLAAFGMQISYTATQQKDTPAGWVYQPDAVALADGCDFLFVALAASAATRHIVNADVIRALGPDGMLINISRAANVDEGALLAALQTGSLGSAALDVFEGEPLLNPRFLTLPNVLLQPHVGSATTDTRRAMGRLVRNNLAAHFAGGALLTPVI